ncbi:hypothetical protein NP493_341g01000 [Ridgeia piscesae]|uniref:Uncharacterized protein n=1 Tax=Ridgeia piscesae TaxID=27915 RepID=A0AAD9L3N5_RIDPI|nr:hypothetical protein NP493_341g01000 [Ridgeia piscesae]
MTQRVARALGSQLGSLPIFSPNLFILPLSHGFMQDHIIASHTCFGGHMDVNC